MVNSLNRATLVGVVDRGPDIKSTKTGREIATFTLATVDSWQDKNGESREKTEWHRVVVINDGLVSLIKKYIKKGSRVYIEGAVQTRKWLDKGQERYVTEIVLQNYTGHMVLLEGGDRNKVDLVPDSDSTFDDSETAVDMPF